MVSVKMRCVTWTWFILVCLVCVDGNLLGGVVPHVGKHVEVAERQASVRESVEEHTKTGAGLLLEGIGGIRKVERKGDEKREKEPFLLQSDFPPPWEGGEEVEARARRLQSPQTRGCCTSTGAQRRSMGSSESPVTGSSSELVRSTRKP